MSTAKFLRLDAQEVALVVVAFNHSRMSMFPPERHAEVKALVRQLGRFGVASAQEISEDYEKRGRLPKRKYIATEAQAQRPTLTLDDFLTDAVASLRGRKP